MKSLKLLLTTVMLLSASATAQQQDMLVDIEQVKQRLEITDKQADDLKEVIQEFRPKREAVFKKHGINLDSATKKRPSIRTMMALRSDLKDVDAQQQEKLKGILTEEQLDEFEDIQQEFREKIREKIKNRRKD